MTKPREKTREECEEKLKVLIVEMKAEIAEAQRLMDLGVPSRFMRKIVCRLRQT